MLIAKWAIFVLSFLIAALPGALYAQGPGKANYAVLKLGSFLPESGDLDKQDAKDGFAGQIGFGYYLARFFALEVGSPHTKLTPPPILTLTESS